MRAGQPSAAEKAAEAAKNIGKAVEDAHSQAAINNTNAIGDRISEGLGALADQGIDYVGNLNFTSPEEYSFANSVAGENLAKNYVNDAKFYSNYAAYSAQYEQGLRSLSQSDRAVQNALRNHRFEVGNAQAASDFNAVGVSGWQVDLNDDATRAFFAAGQAAKTNAELQTTALAIIGGAVSIPLMAADAVALGGFALRGGIGLGNSIGATVTELGQSLSVYGVRGTVLRAGYPTNFLQVQMASRAAIQGAKNGANFVAVSPGAAVNAGLSRVAGALPPAANLAGKALTNSNIQAGLLSGTTNALVDYGINGSNANIGLSFTSGFIGGSTGNLIGSFASPYSQPLISGLSGGAIGEFADQLIRGEQFNGFDILLSGAVGGAATYGANKALGVYIPRMPIVLPERVVFKPLAAGTVAGISGSVANSTLSDIFKY